jgi:hypothetical protein
VTLVEGAALRVLSAEANRRSGLEQCGIGQQLGHAVVERLLAVAHFDALGEELFYLGMDVEAGWRGGERGGERCGFGGIDAGVRIVGGLEVSAVVRASSNPAACAGDFLLGLCGELLIFEELACTAATSAAGSTPIFCA